MSRWAAIALAAPGCLLAAVSAVALALAAFDRHPMWPHRSVNLAEAVGVRDEAEVVRLIEQGDDPNIRYAISSGLIFDYPTKLTPLEAAVASHDPSMVARLLAKGVVMDAALWAYLRCIADGTEVPRVLDEHRPEGAVLQCDGVRPPWDVDDDG